MRVGLKWYNPVGGACVPRSSLMRNSIPSKDIATDRQTNEVNTSHTISFHAKLLSRSRYRLFFFIFHPVFFLLVLCTCTASCNQTLRTFFSVGLSRCPTFIAQYDFPSFIYAF